MKSILVTKQVDLVGILCCSRDARTVVAGFLLCLCHHPDPAAQGTKQQLCTVQWLVCQQIKTMASALSALLVWLLLGKRQEALVTADAGTDITAAKVHGRLRLTGRRSVIHAIASEKTKELHACMPHAATWPPVAAGSKRGLHRHIELASTRHLPMTVLHTSGSLLTLNLRAAHAG